MNILSISKLILFCQCKKVSDFVFIYCKIFLSCNSDLNTPNLFVIISSYQKIKNNLLFIF